jgi:NhaA family Na+:H+ antiporter
MEQFLRTESAGGILLLLSTGAALLWANSPWHESYENLLHVRVGLHVGSLSLEDSLVHWINHGLMTVFFFLIGMEIKREFAIGELSTPRKAALPVSAALGGMVVPAVIYLLFNPRQPGSAGWAIPMATDIAFALGVLVLLTRNIPVSLKVFLLALAIVDDLGAVLVIAVFYTEQISGTSLGVAALLLGFMALLRYAGVRRLWVSGMLGVLVWLAFLYSGIHATVSGVLLGFLTPRENWVRPPELADTLQNITRKVIRSIQRDKNPETIDPADASDLVKDTEEIRRSISPLDRLVHVLHPWVSFVVIPVFAFANAGIRLTDADMRLMVSDPLPVGIALGLLIGKPAGILSCSWISTKLGFAEIPRGVTWPMMAGVALLAGIGFTMALFISDLAFQDPNLLMLSKVGIFAGSILSGVLGFLVLRYAAQRNRRGPSRRHGEEKP